MSNECWAKVEQKVDEVFKPSSTLHDPTILRTKNCRMKVGQSLIQFKLESNSIRQGFDFFFALSTKLQTCSNGANIRSFDKFAERKVEQKSKPFQGTLSGSKLHSENLDEPH